MPQEKDKNANRVQQFPSHVGLFDRIRKIRQVKGEAANKGRKKKKK